MVDPRTPPHGPGAPDGTVAALRILDVPDRILGLYEYAIDACAARDAGRARAALLELLGTLDFAYGEVAEGFARLYEYCLRKVHDGEFDRAAWILHELRATWRRALDDGHAGAASA
jgi:hypothetical protein